MKTKGSVFVVRVTLFQILAFGVCSSMLHCGENEILLHNRTCKCPFFRYNDRCMRKRYQTTVNTSIEKLQSARHLLGSEQLLLTIDATNYEAMRALAAMLTPLVSAGTVVTSVVDAMDTLVGGEPSATMEIVNASVVGATLTLTVEFRLPDVDFFFWFMHFGSSPAPCPPFDAMDRCCWGDMGGEFLTTGVDCSSRDTIGQMRNFVAAWNGQLSLEQERFTVSIDLEKHGVPSVVSSSATVYRLGIGMVVFGRLAQNTESRVEIQLNNTVTATSVGVFQYSGIEFSRLQLETCGGKRVFMHLIVKAANISAVQSVRFKVGGGVIWRQPNCTQTRWKGQTTMGCNVSIDSEFVDVYVPLPSDESISGGGATLYALLSRGTVLTRVVARVDSGVMEHCNEPVIVRPGGYDRDFTVDVLQGNRLKYSGNENFVQLTDVAALTLKVRSNSSANRYSIDNISVVYSLVNSSVILGLMPDGKVTKQLEAMCDSGNVCLIETLMENGVCSTNEKCEVQVENGVFVMPMYPWGMGTLKLDGSYTAMLMDIRETAEMNTTTTTTTTTQFRRLLNWMGIQ